MVTKCGEVQLQIKWTQKFGKTLSLSKYMHFLTCYSNLSIWGMCFFLKEINFSKQPIFDMCSKQAYETT